MSPIPVNLAVEDAVSEAVLRKALSHTGRGYAVGTVYGKGGFGYLRRTIDGWNRAAAGIPFIVLTDLDNHYRCPAELISDWLAVPLHENLLFRIAVREVESWILADKKNLAGFLSVPVTTIPDDVELLADPKTVLIGIARKSSARAVRDRIVPRQGSTATVGPDYNGCLIEFVRSNWSPTNAAAHAPSLARALARFAEFHPVWPSS